MLYIVSFQLESLTQMKTSQNQKKKTKIVFQNEK